MAYPSLRFRPSSIFYTTLDATITGATDPILVVDNSNAPDAPGIISIDNEEIYYAVKGVNEFSTLTRGYNNTKATGHDSGRPVACPISTDLFSKLWDAIEYLKTQTDLVIPTSLVTAKGDIIAATGDGAVDNIAVGADDTILVADSAEATGVKWEALDTLGVITKTDAQTLTGKKTMGAVVQTVKAYTPDAAATATLDVSLGNIHSITMPAGNITIAISNETAGQCFIIEITQDGTGSRTVTWFTTIKWVDGSAPTLTTTADKRDVFGFRVTGTDTYDGYVIGQNI